MEFRHEFKYLCTEAQIKMLQSRLRGIMKPDSHAGPSGTYKVRSLYFDDMQNTCYYENENGVCPRKKYRIRIYNGQGNVIHLECKRKVRGMTSKKMCTLSREQYDILVNRQSKMHSFDGVPELMQELLVLIDTKMMRPKVIVEYDRRPFVYRDGNVRITFDSNISSSSKTERFFEERICGRPILPVGAQLLEVKYDSFLPDHIYQILQSDRMQMTTFSKYYLCRKFSDVSF
ncbi:MAG: polyphosphate polymerase domain-containing protein [Lachnospiraceae bacterium]|nr:polyphosphate polymerase domain-containing protein [Lachnospiraceae bacterium]